MVLAVEILSWPLITFVGLPAVAVLVGFIFRWWGLLANAAFVGFLAYVWGFEDEGLLWTPIVSLVALFGVVFGSLAHETVVGNSIRDIPRR